MQNNPPRLLAMWGGVGVASLLLYGQTQKVSWRQTVALSRPCVRLLIFFVLAKLLTAAKTNTPKCEVCAMLSFFKAKLYSATATHQEIFTMNWTLLNEQKVMSYAQNICTGLGLFI